MIIKGVALIKNGYSLHEAPLTVNLNCENLEIKGTEWIVPIIENNHFQNYSRTISALKPQVDAVKAIRVLEKVQGTITNEYWLVINDDKDVDYLTNFCNGCCGSNPEMEAVTIPTPIVEEAPCAEVAEGTSTYTFTEPFPENPEGLDFLLALTLNGSAPTPAPTATGFADEAAVLAFVQANYAGGGDNTWTIVDVDDRKVLKLVSTSVSTASLNLTLEPATYCLEVPNLAGTLQVDSIVIGTTPVTIDFPETTLNDTVPDAVLLHLQGILGAGITKVENGGTTYYQYTGVQKPVKLQLSGVDKVSFTSGACF